MLGFLGSFSAEDAAELSGADEGLLDGGEASAEERNHAELLREYVELWSVFPRKHRGAERSSKRRQ